MKSSTTFQRVVVVLLLCQFGLTFVTLNRASKIPDQYKTTVYSTQQAIPGPIGAQGTQGIPGLSLQGPKGDTVYNQIPIIVQGQKADPCTVTQDDDGNTVVTCPDGSTSVIPKPADGTNGDNGSNGADGADARQVDIVRNSTNGNIEVRYDGDSSGTVLIRKCEYLGTCDDTQ